MWRSYFWPPRILQTLAWGPTRLLFNIFCRFEVRGVEHLSELRQAIFAVNHANELDPILLTAALNPLGRFAPLFYIAGPLDFFDDTSFGWRRYLYTTRWFFRAWGAYPHSAGHKNYAVSLASHRGILRDGGSICIFPEGRMTRDGNLLPARGGVSYLSHATRVPVVPVAIVGAYRMSFLRFWNRRYKITLIFGKPRYMHKTLPHAEPEIEHFKEAAHEILEDVKALMQSVAREAREVLKELDTQV